MKNIFFPDESVKRRIINTIIENLTDSDLESTNYFFKIRNFVNKGYFREKNFNFQN